MAGSAESIRAALLRAAESAWEDAGIRGLCAEGRWEAVVSALRDADIRVVTPGPDAAAPGTGGSAPPASRPPEAWLRGPIEGVPAALLPAAHSLTDGLEDMERAVAGLTPEQIWLRPGGVAAIGFHLRHVRGSTDRLLTYARGEMLTPAQMDALKGEAEPGSPPAGAHALLEGVRAAVAGAIAVYRETDPARLSDARAVGRARLPGTLGGLLFHVAEHARRHAGQVVATAGIIRGLGLRSGG